MKNLLLNAIKFLFSRNFARCLFGIGIAMLVESYLKEGQLIQTLISGSIIGYGASHGWGDE